MKLKNPAAVALGRLGAGRPKKYTRAELARRRVQMVALNVKREQRKSAQYRACGPSNAIKREITVDKVMMRG